MKHVGLNDWLGKRIKQEMGQSDVDRNCCVQRANVCHPIIKIALLGDPMSSHDSMPLLWFL